MQTMTTQAIIDELMQAFYGENGNMRQKYIFEQTLRNLVRLAKAEQMMEIRSSVRKLTGTISSGKNTQQAKNVIHRH